MEQSEVGCHSSFKQNSTWPDLYCNSSHPGKRWCWHNNGQGGTDQIPWLFWRISWYISGGCEGWRFRNDAEEWENEAAVRQDGQDSERSMLGDIISALIVLTETAFWQPAGDVKWAVSCLSLKFLERSQLESHIWEFGSILEMVFKTMRVEWVQGEEWNPRAFLGGSLGTFSGERSRSWGGKQMKLTRSSRWAGG